MFTVYTKNNCPNCVQAKNILKVKNVEFKEENVDDDEALKAKLMELGFKSMPQIYDDVTNAFIPNGHRGLLQMLRDGKLK